jgi:transcriptional regulator with XRE-family HTH domain
MGRGTVAKDRDDLARDIKAFRQSLGWTLDDMSRKLEVTSATISRWENGISIPRPEHLGRIAEISHAHKTSGRKVASFLARYQNIREKEHVARSLARAAGVLGSHNIGGHLVELLEDGSLLVNGGVRISP